MKYRLEIAQIEQICLFKLSWGKGQQLSAKLPYPIALFQFYSDWRKAYFNFYKTSIRARVPKPKNQQGKIQLSQDWHRQLVQLEAKLLSEFYRWLRREELYDIRATIATFNRELDLPINLFITCSGDLERLPWETWEIGAEFNSSVSIIRSPVNIHADVDLDKYKPSCKPRILAILGDDTGLDLKGDRNTINSLNKVADIELVTWQPQQKPSVIKQQIQTALTDEKGWSILFFAGHSNESTITGGELAIAPKTAISISEIAPQLAIAKNNGLQFALFNSCSGLSIANSLIDLGLSQVAVMREPIHNRVAQVFLVQFLKALANYQNVRDALQTACNYLKQKQNLTYPSAYLIPSLFCHPDAKLFQIEPWGWRKKLKCWLPNKKEAIALTSLCFLSILPPVQNFLLDKRVLVQAIYRDATAQLPSTSAPITLIHIDPQSLTKAGITNPVPMDRSYLGAIIDHLAAKESKIIGFDYLFDRPQPENDPILARSVLNAVQQNQTWFIFGAFKQIDRQEIGVAAETTIGNPNWTLQGYTDGLPNYISLLPASETCETSCPFAYLLAMVNTIEQSTTENAPIPKIDNQTNLRDRVYEYANGNSSFFRQTKLHPLTNFVQYFGQQWLRPIEDFSLPPDLVYNRLPAWQLLQNDDLPTLQHQVVLIGSGGYAEAGLTEGSDNFKQPSAIAYWRIRRNLNQTEAPFTGSELLAYMTHHFIKRRLVIPIPELWLIAIAHFVAKGIKLTLEKRNYSPKLLLVILSSTMIIYCLLVLQLYISTAILIPLFLPSVAMGTFLFLGKQKKLLSKGRTSCAPTKY
jgi:CHASE2 domain-containing sensor protein